MKPENPASGPRWGEVTRNNTFGDAVRRARVAPSSMFPVTLVELRGTGTRGGTRLLSNPDSFRIELTPPAGISTRRRWFPDGDLWEVSRVAVVHEPPSGIAESPT
jgi:hypothetical protein